MSRLSRAQMEEAVSCRDSRFDGQFVYGVVTTGVFCQPSCPSRAARPENRRYFPTVEEAVHQGFRPCLRCKPLGSDNVVSSVVTVASHIQRHADDKLTLAQLSALAGQSASAFQRNFKRIMGLTPKAFQAGVRAHLFKRALREQDSVTEAIYSAGYGSSSRVYESASNNIGMSPSAYRQGGKGEILWFTSRRSALGPLMMAATERGVCFAQFGDDEATLRAQLQTEFPNAKLVATPRSAAPEVEAWIDALNDHVGRGGPSPELPMDLRGTAFQLRVWKFLLGIPEGQVVSYGEVAKGIGSPKAVRAAASACGANRVAVLVPCHRVLRGDGALGGYRWGVDRKRTLLDAERSSKSRPGS